MLYICEKKWQNGGGEGQKDRKLVTSLMDEPRGKYAGLGSREEPNDKPNYSGQLLFKLAGKASLKYPMEPQLFF